MAIALSPPALGGSPGGGATFTVNRTNDDGDFNTADPFCDADPVQAGSQCTVRAGIQQTNAQPGSDRLVVPNGNYPLDSQLTVTDSLVIDGAKAATTIVRATGPGRVLEVNSGALVELQDATIRDGVLAADGGGILNQGSLLLRRVAVRNNQAIGEEGGGIYSAPGARLTVLDSVIGAASKADGNSAGSGGGGIAAAGQLIVRDSTITGNTLDNTVTFDEGAGISAFGNTTVVRTTVAGNGGPDTRGAGGLRHFGSPMAPLRVLDSTISGNAARELASGMSVRDEVDAVIENVTVSGNTNTAADGLNSAIFVQDGPLSIRHATVAGNTQAQGAALRLFNDTGDASVELQASVIDSDSVPVCIEAQGSTETLVSTGFNVLDDAALCEGSAVGSDTIAEPSLRALADNGGPTLTRALRPGSEAVDHVAKGSCPTPARDQRGVTRAQGKRCDAGAYELARCAGVIVNRVGTNGKDRLRGTAKRDGFLLGGGKDKAKGKGGKDGLCGEGGKDKLDGGPGRDKCVGGPGKDKLRRCERGS